jgi:shikimate kinase
MSRVTMIERKPWSGENLVILLGPGGAGKSSLAFTLAPLTRRHLIDLDRAFATRIAPIDEFIQEEGYASYKVTNARLAAELVEGIAAPTIFVTSSGFLSLENPPHILSANRKFLQRGYSICLLPAADEELACEIIVKRQVSRPLGYREGQERRKFQERWPLYRSVGDMLILSAAPPEAIAEVLAQRLKH